MNEPTESIVTELVEKRLKERIVRICEGTSQYYHDSEVEGMLKKKVQIWIEADIARREEEIKAMIVGQVSEAIQQLKINVSISSRFQ